MNKYRTHNCGELREKDINKTITLSGWLHRKRDHGNLLFIDLRDHYGLTQCVIENKSKFFSILEKTKSESVIKISGKVKLKLKLKMLKYYLILKIFQFQYLVSRIILKI